MRTVAEIQDHIEIVKQAEGADDVLLNELEAELAEAQAAEQEAAAPVAGTDTTAATGGDTAAPGNDPPVQADSPAPAGAPDPNQGTAGISTLTDASAPESAAPADGGPVVTDTPQPAVQADAPDQSVPDGPDSAGGAAVSDTPNVTMVPEVDAPAPVAPSSPAGLYAEGQVIGTYKTDAGEVVNLVNSEGEFLVQIGDETKATFTKVE